jgi:hypothetical protein
VRAAHVFDLISYDGDRDGAAELWAPSPALAAAYGEVGALRGVPIRVVEEDLVASDHRSFLAAGFVATGVSEELATGDTSPNYHQPTDTVDNVDLPFLASITRLGLAVVGRDVAVP